MAEGRVVGIDLGTTNSLVAFMEGDQPVVIPGEDGDRLVPSVVAWTDDGIAVGHAARTTLLTDSANAVYSAKRLMGRDIADVQEELKLFPFKLVDGLQQFLGDQVHGNASHAMILIRALYQDRTRFRWHARLFCLLDCRCARHVLCSMLNINQVHTIVKNLRQYPQPRFG